jgi:hypothetical protein
LAWSLITPDVSTTEADTAYPRASQERIASVAASIASDSGNV